MEGLLFGLGVLLVIFGPLLLIPIIWIVYRFGTRPVLRAASPTLDPSRRRIAGLALAGAVVGGAVLLSYLPGRRAFDRLCADRGAPTVAERVRTDGYYRTRLFPYEARRILEEDGFAFVEAPDPYAEDRVVRYSLGPDGSMREADVASPESDYGVRMTVTERSHGIVVTEKVVYELASARELARAAHVVYGGGPLSLFMGALGTSTCPDIRSEAGSRRFRTFYDLEGLVLGGA